MMPPPSRLPQVDEAELRALGLRELLGLGSDALGDVFELLEHLGLQIVRWPMGTDGPDGFYIAKGQLAVVALNSAKHIGRQRFTACHELGHHLFDRHSRIDRDVFAGHVISERRANAFAAFFLIPREGVWRWLRQDGWQVRSARVIDAEKVVHLARHFGASYEATLYQLSDLRVLQKRELEALKSAQPDKIARRLGYDALAGEQERGRRILPADYVKRALLAYGAGDISLARLGELLRADEESTARFVSEAGICPPETPVEDLKEETRRARHRRPEVGTERA